MKRLALLLLLSGVPLLGAPLTVLTGGKIVTVDDAFTITDARVPVGGGSDHMQKIGSLRSINPCNPWLGTWTAITRKCRGLDEPLHPAGGLTREEAIRLYTIHNARVLFLEKETGSLAVGKRAGFIILERDVLACPIDALKDTQCARRGSTASASSALHRAVVSIKNSVSS